MNKVFIENNKYRSYLGDISGLKSIELQDLDSISDLDRENFFVAREARLLNENDTIRVFYINRKFVENRFSSKVNVLTENLFDLKDISVYENYFVKGHKYFRLLSVKNLPKTLVDLSALHDFSDYIINYRKLDQNKAKDTLKLKRKLHFSLLFKNIKDIESTNAYAESEGVLEDIIAGENALFEIEVFYLLSADTKKELDLLTNLKCEEFKLYDGELRVESRGLEYFLFNSQAGIRPVFKRKHLTTCSYLNLLLPHHKDKISNGGTVVKSTRGYDLQVNIFDNSATNFNCLITGSSGQGKSMFANKLVFDEISKGKKSVIVDLGNSFEKLTKYLGGESRSAFINPLKYKCPNYLKAFILSTIEGKFSKIEQGRLHESIARILEKSVPCWDEFISDLSNDFPDIRYNFAEIEQFFVDKDEQSSDLIYCDFSEYPEPMKAPILVYLLETFKRIEGEKVFVFDECWFLLTSCADYLAECFRTFRKHGASAIAISQSIDDFSKDDLGRVVIQNTFHKFVFRQQIQSETFVNSEQMKKLLKINSKKGEYSEFLYINDEICKPVRYYPNNLELELFRSDKAARAEFNNYMSDKGKYFDFFRAMNNFVEIKYPQTLTRGENV